MTFCDEGVKRCRAVRRRERRRRRRKDEEKEKEEERLKPQGALPLPSKKIFKQFAIHSAVPQPHGGRDRALGSQGLPFLANVIGQAGRVPCGGRQSVEFGYPHARPANLWCPARGKLHPQ